MNCGSLGAALAASLGLLASFGAQASCEPLTSRGSVIYGGGPLGNSKGSGLICGRQASHRATAASDTHKRSTHALQRGHLETDRESTRLILERELATTQHQLEALRAKGGGRTDVEQQAMHRLELDAQALQREMARHQSR